VLLADAIKINGKVQANNALVSAGNFTMDNSSGSVTWTFGERDSGLLHIKAGLLPDRLLADAPFTLQQNSERHSPPGWLSCQRRASRALVSASLCAC
ncbi:hypothetical protein, partial [Klebsiella pneumoniae]|uniref:hypothetical protein n=1 Tax=Klebsiella pneumoniae TaxID=573 RepID=UPI00210E07F6